MAHTRSTTPVQLESEDQEPTSNGRGRGTQLSRNRIIQGAIAILDADGPSGLSMRRLADNLDAGAMSLYWYVPTKDVLLQLAADTVLAEIQLHDLPDDWRRASQLLAQDLHGVMRRHPWITLLLATQPSLGPNGLALIETMLATLTRGGLSGDCVETAMTTLYGHVVGRAIAETLWVNTAREHRHGSAAGQREATPDRPLLDAFLAATAGGAGDDRFAAGLELVLDGIEASCVDQPSAARA